MAMNVGSVDFYECLRPFLNPKDQEKPVGLTGKKEALRLGRAVFEHAEALLDRGFGHEEIADGFEKAANWFVDHIGSNLSPEFVMTVTRTVKMALGQGDKEVEDAAGFGAGLGAQQNLVQELGQVEDAVAVWPEIGGSSLNDDALREIFKRVNCPYTLLNVYVNEGLPSYQILLPRGQSDLCTYLFPRVAPHLLKYLGRRGQKDFLNLRKTNKLWKQEMDHAFENEDEPQLKPDVQIQFNTAAQLDPFLENAQGHLNPFFIRELNFKYSYDEDRNHFEEYWTKALQLLERHGHHVNGIAVDFVDEEGEAFEFEDYLVRMLGTVVNLKSLRIEGGVHNDNPERMNELRNYFRANSHLLPELHNLKHLRLSFDSIEWTGPLVSKLVADPTQLKSLSMESTFGGEPCWELKYILRGFTNLTHLEIKGKLVEVSQYLESVAAAPRPPLKRIQLKAPEDCGLVNGPGLRSLFQQLEKFGDSLQHLDLVVWGRPLALTNGFDQEFPLAGRSFPNLHSLDLDTWHPEVFQWVLKIEAPLKRLTVNRRTNRLDWQAFYSNLGQFGSTLQELVFYNDSEAADLRMNQSDIHAISDNLPNLRVIKCHGISLEAVEHLFSLRSLNKLNYFHVDFGHNSLDISSRGFELVEQKLNENPSIWQVMSSLREFSVEGEIRPENDADPRARKRKIVSCVRGENAKCRILDRRYLA